MTPATEAVVAEGLIKDYATGLASRKVRALHGLDFKMARGEVVALLGPNGSGKSTTLKIVLGLTRPNGGSCTVLGGSPGGIAVRKQIGYVPDTPDFPGFLTGRELVEFHGQLCGLSGPKLRERVAAVLALVGLTSVASRPLGEYSRGMRQRAGLAQALVHEPELLIMDEPFAGVDPHGTAEIVRIVKTLKQAGRTVLITSHLIGPLEQVCDRVVILLGGRKLCDSSVSSLTRELCSGVRLENVSSALREELQAWLRQRASGCTTMEREIGGLEQAYCRVLDEALRKESGKIA